MENNISIFDLEELRVYLIGIRNNSPYPHLNIFEFNKYFLAVLKLNDRNISEAFLSEFINEYKLIVSKIESFGSDIVQTIVILNELKMISSYRFLFEPLAFLEVEIPRIETSLTKLKNILEGKDQINSFYKKAVFPLIFKNNQSGFYGILESVTVRINKTHSSNKFIIIPSEKNIEENILSQCKISWQFAVSLSKRFVKKVNNYHEVIISFDKKEGFYEGSSLGAALTFSFLEEILKFYNPAYTLNLVGNIAFTGGVSENGELLSTGKEIIKKKINTIFFSDLKVFIFHKSEEKYAENFLKGLKEKYPNRNLKLEVFENIESILNRRDLIEIKKQKLIIRSAKFVKKNWMSAVAAILLAVLFSFLYLIDLDDNPYSYYADGNFLHIRNKNGKTLWSFNERLSNYNLSINIARHNTRIFDINNDGINEVISVNEFSKNENAERSLLLKCYDKNKKIIWAHKFSDIAESNRGKLINRYSIIIIDTLTMAGKKSLVLISNNSDSFSSAIYRIDLRTGKRLPGTFWASGHSQEGTIKDIDNDGIKEFIGAGYDNGFQDLVFFSYSLDTLTSVRPTTDEYLIRNYKVNKMKSLILFPKSDYDIYYGVRTPSYNIGSFNDNTVTKKYCFGSSYYNDIEQGSIGYRVDYNFKDIEVIIQSNFRARRDSLVAHGKLNPPFTDTDEYCNIIKSNIKYWNGKDFVHYSEFNTNTVIQLNYQII
ncbi:MAG: hypothetical protein IPK06_02075 [Ignavibacteriae bacterium]|nr:hypothetical protein [Ignavibacteriota bacterium]